MSDLVGNTENRFSHIAAASQMDDKSLRIAFNTVFDPTYTYLLTLDLKDK